MDKIKKQTFTLTYGNCAENHKSMEIIGTQLKSGLELADLQTAQAWFVAKQVQTELFDLKDLIKDLVPKSQLDKIAPAHLLVVRKGVNSLIAGTADDLYMEQERLEKDKKAFMYGRVVNKKARHNLCFSDFSQEPDYENKKGTVINFTSVPHTNRIRQMIPKIIPNSIVANLQCEGNYYYDVNTTYIGMHGDTERQIVIAVRLGGDFSLHYQWYHQGERVGPSLELILSHGDMYIMSDKAVGHDWKKSSIFTLRHGAGPKHLIGLEAKDTPETKVETKVTAKETPKTKVEPKVTAKETPKTKVEPKVTAKEKAKNKSKPSTSKEIEV